MMPGIQYSLEVCEDGVYVRYVNSAKQKTQTHRKIESVEDFITFIKERAKKFRCQPDDFIIMCSSSMDFPEESTKNKKVIALAYALR